MARVGTAGHDDVPKCAGAQRCFWVDEGLGPVNMGRGGYDIGVNWKPAVRLRQRRPLPLICRQQHAALPQGQLCCAHVPSSIVPAVPACPPD